MTDNLIRTALGDVIEVREKLAEVGTDVKHLAHDVKNVLMAMGNFVPRREIEAMQQASLERATAIHERITALAKSIDEKSERDREALDNRMDRIEEGQTWLTGKILGLATASATGGGGVVFGLVKFLGH